ncbi:MAG: hypothetical protein GU352_05670 [Acidilobus sp.]|nr:hypothetical protein [Acidilobus sp.]MCG2896299.1 hypothetical protein [Acidilobus sp.]NAZ32181.1 hypothetical protein [Acidilobus sp.]
MTLQNIFLEIGNTLMKDMTRRGQQVFERIVVDHVARIAAGLEGPEGFYSPLLSGHVQEAIRLVGLRLRRPRELPITCPLCGEGSGSFTPKGYYLHLLRAHRQELLDLVQTEALRIAGAARAAGP